MLSQLTARSSRCICTSTALLKLRAGKPRRTRFKNNPVTYEQVVVPQHIGVRKSWLTWHTADLEGFRQGSSKHFPTANQAHRVAEDDVIRRFIHGTWHKLFLSELIIKRRGNVIYIGGFITRTRMAPARIYWLIGYTEEMLGHILKQPVKLELQSLYKDEDIIYEYV